MLFIVYYRGFQPGKFPRGNFRRNWNHRLADLKRWNICILADLAEVVAVIVYRD